ncbi:hypothetical protein T265_00550 [Opisthorchis viverrini]|uniref:F-box domain-containing protein n=1 Tax=Opisthorchis viverrini TaxID=6198 RepID=A0A075A2V8_OPIVI|nr:hypothetical protein T265_00550 [Opisthorchis viverrini]KER33666.1 hypothetical protein T265_00550 [Opisthorchis viverrini]
MDKLPSEVLFRIFQFLSCEDLRSCALVCRQWNILASDNVLWSRKLTKLVQTKWSVVVCNQPYAIDKKLLGLYERDPQSFYFRFQKYVPLSLVKQSYVTGPESSIPGAYAFKSAILPRFIPHWWNEDERNLLHRSTGGVQGSLNQEYRFAVLGSGLDRNLSTNLFARLLNGRVGPFELLQIFPGRLGYGGGLSLRAHGYAQANVLDTSMRPQEAYPPIIADDFQSDDGASPRVSAKRTHVYRHRRSKHHSARSPYVEDALDALSVGSRVEDKNQPKDLIFDLVLLYADMNERHNENKDELRRILTSRLFLQPRAPATGERRLFELEFREELDPVMKTINGLIYAVESKVPNTHLIYSHYELKAALRKVAPRIPVVVLYISSESESDLCNTSGSDGNMDQSILFLLDALGLCTLSHPWRLQKCMDNDLLAILQSALWMRAHLSSGRRVCLSALTSSLARGTTR